jgi:hypothetical protein
MDRGADAGRPDALSDGHRRPPSVVPGRSLLRLMYLIGVVFAVVVSGAMCSADDTSGRAGDVCPLRLRSLGRDPIAPLFECVYHVCGRVKSVSG